MKQLLFSCLFLILSGPAVSAPFLLSGPVETSVTNCTFERAGVNTVNNPIHKHTSTGNNHCWIDTAGLPTTVDITFNVSSCNLRGCGPTAPCTLPSGLPKAVGGWTLVNTLP